MRWKESTRNRARYEDPPVGIFAANDNKTRGDHATRREPLNSKFNMLLTARSGALWGEKEEYVGWKVVWVAKRRFVKDIVRCMHTLRAGGSVQTAQTDGKGRN